MFPRKVALVSGISAGFLSFFAPLTSAQPSSPADPVYACRTIPESTERLACFDSAVAVLFEKQQAGQVQTIDSAAIEQIERESFGFALPSLPSLFTRNSSSDTRRENVSEIMEPVRSARLHNITRKAVITLENGQVWEQIDTTRVSSAALRRASEARIRRAALGSFLISIDGNLAFRARRVS